MGYFASILTVNSKEAVIGKDLIERLKNGQPIDKNLQQIHSAQKRATILVAFFTFIIAAALVWIFIDMFSH